MTEKTLRRRAHAAGLVLAKTRTEIDGANFWLLIRGRRVLAVCRDASHIARALEKAA
ncbi:hypothetical protein APY04_1868 [Hyphomicrobium sulfonivorans]|uniref:Uncharacterized protein n=1 Tax=Hyphomicrobium sulfonivorans TaxID=121290 RepID=A0A109BF89_HYPSL|nr:hypothetical protein [Hyphomicrobium sulfonivorans]KWT67509.1 hypothetical protein APY04_1868 [Hyphomicrobium sulfonivorans]